MGRWRKGFQPEGREDETREAGSRFYFTAEELTDLVPRERRYVVIDTDIRGLQLAVHPSGRKTFYHRRETPDGTRRVKLGEFSAKPGAGLAVSAARRKAEDINGRYSRMEDPGEERRRERETITGQALFDLFMARHMRPHRRPSSVKAAEQLWRDYLEPTLGKLRLSRITRGAVASLHGTIGLDHPTRANRALEVLSSMCSKAIEWELAPAAWQGVNPCIAVTSFTERPRKRFLRGDELARLFAALEPEPAHLRDFFLLSLWTGARRANVQAMKWEAVDLPTGTWTVAAGEAKGGETMQLVLTAEAVGILTRRKAEADELVARVTARTLKPVPRLKWAEARRWRLDARKAAVAAVYVFPGWGASGHLVEPKRAWDRVLERAGIADLRIHDLRRSVGAWLAGGGVNQFVIQKSLGHKSLAATAVYAQLDLAPVRAAMEQATGAMRAAAEKAGEQHKADAAKVASIDDGRRAGGKS